MHRPDDTITAALWDHSRSSLVIAGSRLGVWKNKGAIHSSKHSHEAPVTGALYNSHFHQVRDRKATHFPLGPGTSSCKGCFRLCPKE